MKIIENKTGAVVPENLPDSLRDSQVFIDAIGQIAKIQAGLDQGDRDLAAALQLEPPDTGLNWFINRIPIPGIKDALAERADPISSLTYNTRDKMNQLADHMGTVAKYGRQGIDRYNQLSDIIAQIQSGQLPPSAARRIIADSAAAGGVAAVRLIEQQVNDMLDQLPDSTRKNLEEQDLEALIEVRDLSVPIAKVLQTAMALSALSMRSLQTQFYKLAELGPAISASRTVSQKVIDAGKTSLQIPALVRAETRQAMNGMLKALEAIQIQDDAQRQGGRELLTALSQGAVELSGQLARLVEPDDQNS